MIKIDLTDLESSDVKSGLWDASCWGSTTVIKTETFWLNFKPRQLRPADRDWCGGLYHTKAAALRAAATAEPGVYAMDSPIPIEITWKEVKK